VAAIEAINDAMQLTTPGDGTVIEQKLGDKAVTNLKVDDEAINARTIDGGDATGIVSKLDLNRNGKDGVFTTPSAFAHRAGPLAYKFQNGRGNW
jgi:hypothetical protein